MTQSSGGAFVTADYLLHGRVGPILMRPPRTAGPCLIRDAGGGTRSGNGIVPPGPAVSAALDLALTSFHCNASVTVHNSIRDDSLRGRNLPLIPFHDVQGARGLISADGHLSKRRVQVTRDW